MARWRANMPRYRTPIILQRTIDGPSSKTGNQRSGSNIARVLKAFDTTSRTKRDADNNLVITLPSVPAPADHYALPGTYAPGWVAWWGTPPATSVNPYKIPDPPKIDRTALPTSTNPILWEAYAEVGTNVWEARISAVYVLCEWMPKTGSEQLKGQSVIEIQEAALKMRPSIIATAGINPKEWGVLRVQDNSQWHLQAITPSFRRNEFVELMVRNTR